MTQDTYTVTVKITPKINQGLAKIKLEPGRHQFHIPMSELNWLPWPDEPDNPNMSIDKFILWIGDRICLEDFTMKYTCGEWSYCTVTDTATKSEFEICF